MKQISILLFLFCSMPAIAQHTPNAVDSINSQESLQAFFFKQLNSSDEFKDYPVYNYPLWIQPKDFNDYGLGHKKVLNDLFDSIRPESLVKKDFNGDGKTDLVVKSNGGFTFYFFSKANNSFKIKTLENPLTTDFPNEIFLKNYKSSTIDGVLVYTFEWRRREKYKIYCDTMVCKYGVLLPYKPFQKSYNYKEISVRASQCYGKCPVYTITVGNNGNIVYEAAEYCGPIALNYNFKDYYKDGHYLDSSFKGTFQYKLSKDSFTFLMELLDYIAPQHLDPTYKVYATDFPTISLDITYDNGRKVKIQDYGEQGTYGLIAFYDYIENLRRNLKWERVSNH